MFVKLNNFVLKLWFGDDRPSLNSSSPPAVETDTEKMLLNACRLRKNKGKYPQGLMSRSRGSVEQRDSCRQGHTLTLCI